MTLCDEEPLVLPDEPRFKVFEESAISLLGRLLNPDCQPMDKMIMDMPRIWRVYDKVRGIALSRDKFQFIFQREEDLLTVLKDRPWSYNHWTMLLEWWTPSPPRDFLTMVDVWIQISKIPVNYYKLETMDFLADKVGKVIEIAYDPKASQKEAFIRAHVRLDIANPAICEKVLTLPTGEQVLIEYAYEKLRKRCFHCQRLTHERPACPWTRKKAPPSKPRPLIEAKTNTTEAFVVHAQSSTGVAPSALESDLDTTSVKMPKLTTDLQKDKGHVFGFEDHHRAAKKRNLFMDRSVVSETVFNDQEGSSSSSPLGPTVFRMGSSSETLPSGTRIDGKKPGVIDPC
ncbi:uncharacterized protein LOC18027239 [Eutrema salsugineum]|uniref:uncharacterized protein LOC18027239 n=1 Tax=Eutrema salsugineum TaxID=72664 RepID=UPI000CED48E9|nr:uncharacterized protein LOC18027239 [Eutrema salsugineum]